MASKSPRKYDQSLRIIFLKGPRDRCNPLLSDVIPHSKDIYALDCDTP